MLREYYYFTLHMALIFVWREQTKKTHTSCSIMFEFGTWTKSYENEHSRNNKKTISWSMEILKNILHVTHFENTFHNYLKELVDIDETSHE